jgi:HK97 family phage portal protein
MGVIERIKAWFPGQGVEETGMVPWQPSPMTIASGGSINSLEVKKAFDAVRIGIQGRPLAPDTDIDALLNYSRRNELVYACIEKKAQAAIDPEVIVEKRSDAGEWEPIPGHPLRALLNWPNELDDAGTFLGSLLTSLDVSGVFYAEIVRQGGVPVELWPLNPARMKPIPGKGPNNSPITGYEYDSGDRKIHLDYEDVLRLVNPDIRSRFHGLSPLAVAIGAVDADLAQTDFVRAFFNNDGVPSGILKTPSQTLQPGQVEKIRQQWQAQYSRGGRGYKGVAVLDQNVDYTKVGANLSELEADSIRGQAETRICMCFGVPPLLVSAYVGMLHVNQRASARESQNDFWMNTMSPTFKMLRSWLTKALLPEFVDVALIKAEKIRVNWDMSQVMALQEDKDKHSDRARKDFQAGGITLNEYRAATGRAEDPEGDYYVRATATIPQTPEAALVAAEKVQAGKPPDGSGTTGKSKGDKESKSADPTYWREPTPVESLLDLKGMAATFEAEPATLAMILKRMRTELIKQAVTELVKTAPADLHTLVLTPPAGIAKAVRAAIVKTYGKGRKQVADDLARQSAAKSKALAPAVSVKTDVIDPDDETDIDDLADLTVSRTVNAIQSVASADYAGLLATGLTGDELEAELESDLNDSSEAPLERAAREAANRALSMGRSAEGNDRSGEWGRVEYSALLDQNTCGPCEEADGQSASNEDDLPPAPNPDCEGGGQCRCFHVFVGNED